LTAVNRFDNLIRRKAKVFGVPPSGGLEFRLMVFEN
jgi:hypothetical protein